MNPPAKTAPLIYIAVPSHDNRWHVQFCMSLIRLANAGLFNLCISKLSGGGIAKARDIMASRFIEHPQKPDRIMFIDSDIEFEPGMVKALYDHDLDIVGGLYAHKKAGPPIWSVNPFKDGSSEPDLATGMQKVASVGTGFVMIKRRVLEEMILRLPEIAYSEDFLDGLGERRWNFFQMGVVHEKPLYDKPVYMTEDWHFFHTARKLGFSVYVDNAFFVKHWDAATCFPTEPPKVQP